MQEKNHEISVEFIFEVKSILPFRKIEFPIQNRPFRWGLRIKNIGNNIFPGATLKALEMRSMEHKELYHRVPKEFNVSTLNPDNEIELWVDDLKTYLEGLVWIQCDIVPLETTNKITTFQIEEHTRKLTSPKTNNWGNASFIQSQNQVQSTHTNFLLLILTLLIFVEGLLGIKNIVVFILDWTSKFFYFLGELIQRLIK